MLHQTHPYIVGVSCNLFIRAHHSLCTNFTRRQAPSSPNNAAMCVCVCVCVIQQSHPAGNQIFYAHQFDLDTCTGERKKKETTQHVVCSSVRRHDAASRQSEQARRTLRHGAGRVIPIVIKYYFWGNAPNWSRASRLGIGQSMDNDVD